MNLRLTAFIKAFFAPFPARVFYDVYGENSVLVTLTPGLLEWVIQNRVADIGTGVVLDERHRTRQFAFPTPRPLYRGYVRLATSVPDRLFILYDPDESLAALYDPRYDDVAIYEKDEP